MSPKFWRNLKPSLPEFQLNCRMHFSHGIENALATPVTIQSLDLSLFQTLNLEVKKEMNVSEFMVYTMALFMVLGAIDKLTGGHFGLGKDFDRGLMFMGALAIPLVGAFSIVPLIEEVLTPLITPLYHWMNADPAMFAGKLLSSDTGGYPLALAMAGENNPAGPLSGMILGSTMGQTVSYSIPIMLGVIAKEDQHFFEQGIIIGIGTIPFGVFIGGLVAGYSPLWLLANLLPVFILSGLLMLGQILAPKAMSGGFKWFGKIITIVLTVAFIIAVLQFQTDIVILKGLAPMSDSITAIAAIAFTMAGALPMVRALGWILRKPLLILCHKLDINTASAMGLLSSLASCVAMLSLYQDMDDRGKVLNIAFTVSAQSSIGGLFGFAAAMNPSLLPPMLAAKLSGAVIAICLAVKLCNRSQAKARLYGQSLLANKSA